MRSTYRLQRYALVLSPRFGRGFTASLYADLFSYSPLCQLHSTSGLNLYEYRCQRVAVSRWKVGERLHEVAEGRPRNVAFSSLSPAEQEAACAEFLRERHPGRGDLPILKRLLLPVGRSLEDVDIFGVAEDGALVYAQVTNHPVGSSPAKDKAARLGAYRNAYANEAGADVRKGVRLVFFGVGVSSSDAENISYVSVDEEVEPWMLSDPDHRHGLFGRT